MSVCSSFKHQKTATLVCPATFAPAQMQELQGVLRIGKFDLQWRNCHAGSDVDRVLVLHDGGRDVLAGARTSRARYGSGGWRSPGGLAAVSYTDYLSWTRDGGACGRSPSRVRFGSPANICGH